MAKRSYSPSKCDAQRVEWKYTLVIPSDSRLPRRSFMRRMGGIPLHYLKGFMADSPTCARDDEK